MNTSYKVYKKLENIFSKNDVLGATEISDILWISRVIVHKGLKDLLKEKKIKKIGKWPHTRYKSLIFNENYWKQKISEDNDSKWTDFALNFKSIKILQEYFYKFSPEWRLFLWYEGITEWCKSRKMDTEEKIKNFISIRNHIEELHNECGLISAHKNFGKHFEEVFLDESYYADQYNWMEFGRGKLAEMTFFAKQSQNKKLISQANDEILLKLECIIKKWNFDAIAITPWSIDRKNQLLWMLKMRLHWLNLPFVNIIKYYENNIPIPQKSLKTREQRISNAKNTIFVKDDNISKYKKVFLIDDFVGSGSTLNQTAQKLKKQWVEYVVWFAYVGNLNLSYDVINEV